MANRIKKISITVENEFATSDKNNRELHASVFERAFRKLIHEKSGIGRIFPIYLKVDNSYRILGVFTLNTQGSTTFFPELPGGSFFDHITLGKSLTDNNAHLTEITEGVRKKVSPLMAIPLSNGTYHLITFIFRDLKLLKQAPKKVIYPPVDVELIKLLQDALFTRNGFNGSGLLDAIGSEGSVIVQVFLIPKGIDFRNLQFAKLDNSLFDDEKKLKGITCHIAFIKHEFQDEYQLGLLTFRYPLETDAPAYFGYSIDKSRFYFNSSDKELDASIKEMRHKTRDKR